MSFLFSKDSLIDFAAGWCSGAAAVLCCQPVDTILTRNQAGSQLVVDGIQTTRHLVTASPFKLWRGSAAMISAVPFQNALLMAGYGLGKRTDSNWGVFIGGCTGGVVQSFLMSPVELVKVNQQINVLGSARSTATAAVATKTATTAATLKPSAATIPTATATTTTTISSTRNLASHLFSPHAWRGLGATLLRDGIPHGIWFLSYEVGKQYLGSQSFAKDNENHKSFTVPLLSGAFAATTAWGIGYPADLIKTRIQAGSTTGFMGTARELMAEPGGLYRGFGLKLLRSVPASMIGFVVYEHVAKQLGAGGDTASEL